MMEERAEAVLCLIDSDFGQSGRDVRFMAIRDELVQAFNDGLEQAARICDERDPLGTSAKFIRSQIKK